MSSTRETLDKLYAPPYTYERTSFQGDPETLRSISDDLLQIYAPTKTQLGRALRWLDIRTQSQTFVPHRKEALPKYQMSVGPVVLGELYIQTGDLTVPGHAAGWAVLQLYRESLLGATIQSFNAIDPSLDAAKRFNDYQIRPFSDGTIPELAREILARKDSFANQGLDIIRNPNSPGGSHVVLDNHIDASLPDLLQTVKDTYDFYYPEHHGATSAAVANIVGAHDVDAFHQAWNEASATGETPAAAARLLLQSDVFIG